jgi:hypothetical protein
MDALDAQFKDNRATSQLVVQPSRASRSLPSMVRCGLAASMHMYGDDYKLKQADYATVDSLVNA